jgi:hypothetical protein
MLLLTFKIVLSQLSRKDSTDNMAAKAIIPFLVTMMLVTGVCNTILNKYQV